MRSVRGSGPALHGQQMLSPRLALGAVFGTLSAAAAYGLDAAGFEDALGIVATQSGGLMAA